MRAVGFHRDLPAPALLDTDLPDPVPGERDLLVEVRAISVNPVDTKVRPSPSFVPPAGETKVLGWDAAGVVVKVGPAVRRFAVGDEVFYAGALNRPGANSQLHAVDERLVGHKPKSLDFAAAAALPLTSITAWELLFERLGVAPGKPGKQRSLLVLGAAGGVGSILTQLARRLTSLIVIATTSRPAGREWVLAHGAHHAIDHTQPLVAQLTALGFPTVDLIVACAGSQQHFPALVEALTPQGHLALIDDPQSIDARLLKRKSGSLHWEFMFTRSQFATDDLAAQGHLLDEVAALVDAGVLRSTMTANLGQITAANVMKAHEQIKAGGVTGKLVLAGWP